MTKLSRILVPSFFCIAFIFSATLPGQETIVPADDFSPVVGKLVTLLNGHQDLMDKLNRALAAQEKDSFWYGKTPDEMLRFFEDWRTFSPMLETVMQYVDPFSSLYVLSNRRGYIEDGLGFVRDERFASWMGEFLSAREHYLDGSESALVVQQWMSDNRILMEDYEIPGKGFSSFNEFFTRRLKKGNREITEPNDDSVLVSPADCSLSRISKKLTADANFEVKGESYNVAALLGNGEQAKTFEGGDALLCFLMPENYHRFHSPVSGKVAYAKQVGGYYFGARGFVNNFFEYRRGVYVIENSKVGRMGFVAVGIGEISSVNMPIHKGATLKKGDEIGYFAYGGSAIVMLFEPGQLDSVIVTRQVSKHMGTGTKVMVGERIGSLYIGSK